MKFKPTKYRLQNVKDGHLFTDEGWMLSDPDSTSPSLIRAVYENDKFCARSV